MLLIFIFLSLRLPDLHFDNCCRIEASCAAHPTADVFINFASFRRSVLISWVVYWSAEFRSWIYVDISAVLPLPPWLLWSNQPLELLQSLLKVYLSQTLSNWSRMHEQTTRLDNRYNVFWIALTMKMNRKYSLEWSYNFQVVIGPATVGGIQAGAFKIGDTAGTIDNIIHCKLYRPGSVGFVSKSVCSYSGAFLFFFHFLSCILFCSIVDHSLCPLRSQYH